VFDRTWYYNRVVCRIWWWWWKYRKDNLNLEAPGTPGTPSLQLGHPGRDPLHASVAPPRYLDILFPDPGARSPVPGVSYPPPPVFIPVYLPRPGLVPGRGKILFSFPPPACLPALCSTVAGAPSYSPAGPRSLPSLHMEGAGRGRERDKNTDEKSGRYNRYKRDKKPGAICPRSPVLTHSGSHWVTRGDKRLISGDHLQTINNLVLSIL